MKAFQTLQRKAVFLKYELTVVYSAFQDPRTPVTAKLLIFAAIGYALSPVDLIPHFIPVLGLLDDLILIPLLISLAVKMIPAEVMADARSRASSENLPEKKLKYIAVVLISWAVMLGLCYLLFRSFCLTG